MAQRVRLHMRVFFGLLPTSIVIEPVNIFARYTYKGWKDYIVGFDDYGYPHEIAFDDITHTSVPDPLPERVITTPSAPVTRLGWNAYE